MDDITLAVFSVLGGRLSEKTAGEQFRTNSAAWPGREGKYIEDQAALTAFSYGRAGKLSRILFFKGRELTAAENACEVIAAYNALLSMGKPEGFPELLREFAGNGICARGVFGTDPGTVRRFFGRRGFGCEMLKGKKLTEERLRKLAAEYDCFIFSSFNRGHNPFSMVHTMCVTKEERERFCVHNDHGGCRKAKGLPEAVFGYNNGRSSAIRVLGIMSFRAERTK